jgi:hypothetical protein
MQRCLWTAVFLLAVLAPAARGDLIPGKPRGPVKPPTITAPVVVVIDDKAGDMHVQIPRSLLGQLRADAGDAGDPNTRRAEGLPALHLVIAGTALALALSFGGLWWVRARMRTPRSNVVLLLVAVTALAIGATSLWANVPAPPPPKPKPDSPAQEKAGPPGGSVLAEKAVIDVLDKGETIILIVNSNDLAKVMKNAPLPAPTNAPIPAPTKSDKPPEPSK